jgi:hypothetical protein
VLFRFALAVVLGLSACSDDGGNDAAGPDVGETDPGAVTELRQSASLTGEFAGKISIDGQGWPANTSAQKLTINFHMEALAGVRQFELLITPVPANAFEISSAVFAATQPFQELPANNGIQVEGEAMRMGGAIFGNNIDGNATLGTFTIRTSSNFNAFTNAQLVVSLLEIGPSSSQRDRYESETLQLGIDVGGG